MPVNGVLLDVCGHHASFCDDEEVFFRLLRGGDGGLLVYSLNGDATKVLLLVAFCGGCSKAWFFNGSFGCHCSVGSDCG